MSSERWTHPMPAWHASEVGSSILTVNKLSDESGGRRPPSAADEPMEISPGNSVIEVQNCSPRVRRNRFDLNPRGVRQYLRQGTSFSTPPAPSSPPADPVGVSQFHDWQPQCITSDHGCRQATSPAGPVFADKRRRRSRSVSHSRDSDPKGAGWGSQCESQWSNSSGWSLSGSLYGSSRRRDSAYETCSSSRSPSVRSRQKEIAALNEDMVVELDSDSDDDYDIYAAPADNKGGRLSFPAANEELRGQAETLSATPSSRRDSPTSAKPPSVQGAGGDFRDLVSPARPPVERDPRAASGERQQLHPVLPGSASSETPLSAAREQATEDDDRVSQYSHRSVANRSHYSQSSDGFSIVFDSVAHAPSLVCLSSTSPSPATPLLSSAQQLTPPAPAPSVCLSVAAHAAPPPKGPPLQPQTTPTASSSSRNPQADLRDSAGMSPMDLSESEADNDTSPPPSSTSDLPAAAQHGHSAHPPSILDKNSISASRAPTPSVVASGSTYEARRGGVQPFNFFTARKSFAASPPSSDGPSQMSRPKSRRLEQPASRPEQPANAAASGRAAFAHSPSSPSGSGRVSDSHADRHGRNAHSSSLNLRTPSTDQEMANTATSSSGARVSSKGPSPGRQQSRPSSWSSPHSASRFVGAHTNMRLSSYSDNLLLETNNAALRARTTDHPPQPSRGFEDKSQRGGDSHDNRHHHHRRPTSRSSERLPSGRWGQTTRRNSLDSAEQTAQRGFGHSVSIGGRGSTHGRAADPADSDGFPRQRSPVQRQRSPAERQRSPAEKQRSPVERQRGDQNVPEWAMEQMRARKLRQEKKQDVANLSTSPRAAISSATQPPAANSFSGGRRTSDEESSGHGGGSRFRQLPAPVVLKADPSRKQRALESLQGPSALVPTPVKTATPQTHDHPHHHRSALTAMSSPAPSPSGGTIAAAGDLDIGGAGLPARAAEATEFGDGGDRRPASRFDSRSRQLPRKPYFEKDNVDDRGRAFGWAAKHWWEEPKHSEARLAEKASPLNAVVSSTGHVEAGCKKGEVLADVKNTSEPPADPSKAAVEEIPRRADRLSVEEENQIEEAKEMLEMLGEVRESLRAAKLGTADFTAREGRCFRRLVDKNISEDARNWSQAVESRLETAMERVQSADLEAEIASLDVQIVDAKLSVALERLSELDSMTGAEYIRRARARLQAEAKHPASS